MQQFEYALNSIIMIIVNSPTSLKHGLRLKIFCKSIWTKRTAYQNTTPVLLSAH